MRKNYLLIVFYVTFVSLTLSGIGQPDINSGPTDNDNIESNDEFEPMIGDLTIVLSDISDEPVKKIKRFLPLAEYLARELGEYGFGFGEVKIAPDIETLSNWLNYGDVHIYFDSLYPAMMVCEKSGSRPILRRWKDGIAEYHSIIFTHIQSGVTEIEDLRGKVIALEDPMSTSGYMLPLAYLKTRGEVLTQVAQKESIVAEDQIGFIFAGEDQNILEMVMHGKVAAGFIDNDSFQDIPEDMHDQVIILGETLPVARQVVIVGPAVDEELEFYITNILKSLHESDEGLAVLKTLKKTARFDEFPEGSEVALEKIREMYQLVIDD